MSEQEIWEKVLTLAQEKSAILAIKLFERYKTLFVTK